MAWSGLYRDLTRKSYKLPNTIRQEVVKTLLNYTALPEHVGQNALRLQMPSHRGEEPTRNEDRTGQYTDQETWEQKKGHAGSDKMLTNNLPLPPSLGQIVENNTHQVPLR